MDGVWLILALVGYASAAVAFVRELRPHKKPRRSHGMTLLGTGMVFQTFDLVARGIQAGNIPVTNFPQSLSFLAWITALAGLVLIMRLKAAMIGAFVAPSVFVALGCASLLMQHGQLALPDALRSAWLPVHVTLALLGEALFVLAASVSVVYLVYDYRLKAKRPLMASAGGTPSLEKLDRLNYRLLGWGFVLLSLAILSGAIWAQGTWGHFWSWEPRESWSLVTWLLYAGLLESRLTVGWRGRRAAALTIAVFSVLVGSYLGVNLMYPGKHSGSFG